MRFNSEEICILWCIPEPGCDLSSLFNIYTFINRCAAPPQEFVDACFRKAVQTGVMELPDGNHFKIAPQWYAELHRLDDEEESEHAMIEIAEQLSTREFVADTTIQFRLQAQFYEQALGKSKAEGERMLDVARIAIARGAGSPPPQPSWLRRWLRKWNPFAK